MSVILITERLIIKELLPDDTEMFFDFLMRNKEFFKASGPAYDSNYENIEHHRKMLERSITGSMDGRHYKFGIFAKSQDDRIIGSAALSNIVTGNFMSCFLGYRIDEKENLKGYATEALGKVIDFAFNELKLHRIEANIMFGNSASIKVVKKLGFVYEGDSKKYLKINGVWEDHQHFVKLNEEIE